MPSTTTSKLVRCRYSFVVDCDLPGAFDLSVQLPTAILAPQWLFAAHPPAPPPAQLPPDVSFRPVWQEDQQAPCCSRCKANFTLFNRRHHCRHCGLVFCGKCCFKQCTITNLGYSEPVLVCEGCYPTAISGGKTFQEAPLFVPVQAIELPSQSLPTAPPADFQNAQQPQQPPVSPQSQQQRQ